MRLLERRIILVSICCMRLMVPMHASQDRYHLWPKPEKVLGRVLGEYRLWLETGLETKEGTRDGIFLESFIFG